MKTEASCSDEWVRPEDLTGDQALIYRKHFVAGMDSYRLHYKAALRGNRISVARMEWAVNAFALARIRRAVS